jgi:serine protease inhibitor
MWLLLPHENVSLHTVESVLDERDLEKSYSKDQREIVSKMGRIWLPRFKIESKHKLIPLLEANGIKDLFSASKADLGGMSVEKLYVQNAFQKATIEVDEEGTIATAVSSMEMVAGSAMKEPERPIELRFNRPFAYFIRDRVSGKILFLGRMAH